MFGAIVTHHIPPTMQEEFYAFEITHQACYQFTSVSEEKEIQKVVVFTSSDNSNNYNLALLDVLEDGELSDMTESNNDDLRKVLATVFHVVDDFLNKNPDSMIGFKGSDQRRHRLYRIVISLELPRLVEKFVIYGGYQNRLVEFEADTDYEFYFVKRL